MLAPPSLNTGQLLKELIKAFGLSPVAQWTLYDRDVDKTLDNDRSLEENGILGGHHLQLRERDGPRPGMIRDATGGREASQPQARNRIFISYSHEDKRLYNEFLKMLRPSAHRHGLAIWSDDTIEVGTIWREEIERALGCKGVAVLLGSPDFLDSSFIKNNELPPLLQASQNQGTRIFWIACRPCNVQDTEIGNFQCANQPTSRSPRSARWIERRKCNESLRSSSG